jgi:hypothetical protein
MTRGSQEIIDTGGGRKETLHLEPATTGGGKVIIDMGKGRKEIVHPGTQP